MRTTIVLLLALALLALPACQMNERMSGTAFGTGGGAVLGGLIAGSVTGVLVGGLAGGVVGYLVGDYLADQRERCCAPAPCGPTAGACSPYAPSPCASPSYGAPCVGAVKAVDTVALQNAEAARGAVERGRRAATLPEARTCYEEAVRLDPRSAEAWNALGLVRHASGDAAGAETAFRTALKSDPAHHGAQRNLAWVRGGAR